MNRPTNTALKFAGIAVALSVVGGALTGCSSSDSDPDDVSKAASTDGFCAKIAGITTTLSQRDAADPAATVKAIQGWVSEMEDYETPNDLSAEDRDGFEILVSVLKGVKVDAKPQDLQNMLADVPAADVKKMQEFNIWTAKNCAKSAGAS